MELNGWIKLYRKLVDWEWFTDANTLQLFIYLLCTANNQQKNFRGVTIEAGQKMIGRKQLSVELGKSEQEIRTALDHLKSTNEITIKATNRFSIVTICNYAKYQGVIDSEQPTKQPTSQHSINQQTTTNREYKNKENIRNKETYINSSCLPKPASGQQQQPTIEEIRTEIIKKHYLVDATQFFAYYEANGWMLKDNRPMRNWKAALYAWQKNELKNNQPEQPRVASEVYDVTNEHIKEKYKVSPTAMTWEEYQKSQQTTKS